MQRILIDNLNTKINQKVKVSGWIEVIRAQGKIQFLILRDISGKLQLVVHNNEKLIKLVKKLNLESVIEVVGEIKKETQALNGLEMQVKSIKVLSEAVEQLPISVVNKGSEAGQSAQMDWRWIDLRKPERQLIFKVWTEMELAWANYCVNNGYTRIHSPKLMSTPSESGSELFHVDYFDRDAYLAQSPQFYKQMAMASGLEKVFEFGPIFRANPSFTSRHDTEFTGYDFEISFIDSHQDVITEEEHLIIAMLKAVKLKYSTEIQTFYKKSITIPKSPFPQLTLNEAKEILKKRNIITDKNGDLSPEEEREISNYIKEKYDHEFVFITEYPKETRAFYHMRFQDKPNTTKGFDLIYNGLEITTGAQREHRYKILKQQAIEHGLTTDSIQYYLNFFKYGCPPHGGIGFGISRFIMKTLGLSNVREVTYLYRGVKRLTP
jgi:aspartyl-tRNA synthetase